MNAHAPGGVLDSILDAAPQPPLWDQRTWQLAGPLGDYAPSNLQQTPDEMLARPACHILVVDDDLGIRSTLVAFLEGEGYVVGQAANGEEALASLARQRPTLVLLDMRMPVMDGWQFAEALRDRQIDIPLIVMTAARDAQTWATQIAAAAYMTKPFDYDLLLSTLDRLCNERTESPPDRQL